MHQLEQRIMAGLQDICVVLNYGPLGFVQAITEHIGSNQIRVNTGSITLNHDSDVEIVLSIPGLLHRQHHRIAAQVVECDSGGHSTLAFNGCSKETLLALLPYLTRH